jgi:CreA protein
MKHLPVLALALATLSAGAEPIGSVDTAFILIGPDHKVVVEAFDDPKVDGVTC